MIKRFFVCITIINSFIATAQINKNCETLLKTSLNLEDANSNSQEFRKNINQLFDCINFDEYEIASFIETPFLSSILVEFYSNKNVTYLDVKNKLFSVRETANFKQIKNNMIAMKKLEKMTFSIDNWNEAKKILIQLGSPKEGIIKVKEYLINNKDLSHLTFKEASKKLFTPTKKKSEINKKGFIKNNNAVDEKLNKILKQPKEIAFDFFLKKAKEKNKKLLLFFTGYACVNCVKMSYHLAENGVYEKIKENYHLVSLFVDNNRVLPENEWTKSSRKKEKILKTLGEKAYDLQIEKFKYSAQPFFVILDNNGVVIDKLTYSDLEIFKEFINRK